MTSTGAIERIAPYDACLITGQAGSGKSTIGRLLAEEGYRAFDTDSHYRPDLKVATVLPEDQPEDFPQLRQIYAEENYWTVDEEKLEEELSKGTPEDPVIVTGVFFNMWRVLPWFKQAVYLRVSPEKMKENLMDPERDRDFGKTEYWQNRLSRNLPIMQCWMETSGIVAIDADRPLEEVVAEVKAELGLKRVADRTVQETEMILSWWQNKQATHRLK